MKRQSSLSKAEMKEVMGGSSLAPLGYRCQVSCDGVPVFEISSCRVAYDPPPCDGSVDCTCSTDL